LANVVSFFFFERVNSAYIGHDLLYLVRLSHLYGNHDAAKSELKLEEFVVLELWLLLVEFGWLGLGELAAVVVSTFPCSKFHVFLELLVLSIA
jgi:hypothetical protein